jgi:hypothetical protein
MRDITVTGHSAHPIENRHLQRGVPTNLSEGLYEYFKFRWVFGIGVVSLQCLAQSGVSRHCVGG